MMTAAEKLDLAMRVASESDHALLESETAKREGRDNAALILAGKAEGLIAASRMVLKEPS